MSLILYIKRWWLVALFSAVLLLLAFCIWDAQQKVEALEREIKGSSTEQPK